MNVVVRARVNASTDFSSLCASLMAQRDAKQKPIHQLELKVMQANPNPNPHPHPQPNP